MKLNINSLLFITLLFFTISGCSEKEYTMGELAAPTDVAINVEVVGQDATHPNGDESGDVKITISGNNIISYKIDYDATDSEGLVHLPTGKVTKKYTKLGVNTYQITAVAYGRGGTSTTVSKEVTVKFVYDPGSETITNLTGGGSKTWVVEKSASGHFGVGPWSGSGSGTPIWWQAGPNEKAGCCNCFYTAKFTFTKAADNTFSLKVDSPNGAFTKTGDKTTLPGIPANGDEGCYSYSGGTSEFIFLPRSSNAVPEASSTKTSIQLAGNNTYIGYGAVQKEYEIVSLTETSMYLRVRGTEVDNAWYLKLIPQ